RRGVEDRQPGIIEMPPQLRLDLVRDDPSRSALQKPAGGQLEGPLDKVFGDFVADQRIEAVSIMERLTGGVFDSFGQQALTPDFEQTAVSKIVDGRVTKHPDGAALSNESAQALTHPVPINEKNDPRAEMVEVAQQVILFTRLIDPGRVQIGPAFHAVTGAAVDIGPAHLKLGEQALEKGEPLR